ncbi:hypothetical protein [Gloeocapsopsis dulcis]|uniref:hypothetical protein n=1 Tax=Gloeocapsopsis dulcis TaxID=2859516 RepID=UPI00101ADB24|nr:hypothetical protein [Gloeocapsopsis dulcis]WNN89420.1 hypothetical protein P0S91_24840 [Gloeocapsopsis dulcis]
MSLSTYNYWRFGSSNCRRGVAVLAAGKRAIAIYSTAKTVCSCMQTDGGKEAMTAKRKTSIAR